MKKIGFVMRMNKHSFGIMAVLLVSCLVFASCSDMMDRSTVEIPSDLRNTTWTRQVSDTEIVTICFGRDTMTMTSNMGSGPYNQQWQYNGASCCGYGYCSFYGNGQEPLNFRYTSGNNGLNITGARMRSLNGSWTRQ